MTQHITILNPTHILYCGECGKGQYAQSEEVHPTYGSIWKCTWADCDHDVTVRDIQLDSDEELMYVRTEAGLVLAWRVRA